MSGTLDSCPPILSQAKVFVCSSSGFDSAEQFWLFAWIFDFDVSIVSLSIAQVCAIVAMLENTSVACSCVELGRAGARLCYGAGHEIMCGWIHCSARHFVAMHDCCTA